MLTRAGREYMVLLVLLGIFTTFLLPSLLTTRAKIRDGIRLQDVTYLKRSLEHYYNQHETYPGAPEDCITSTNSDAWPFIEMLPHDVREEYGHAYRYCPTSRDSAGTTGYYLEAKLEAASPSRRSFDEDEQRKFYYRVLAQDGQTLYRVCGGEEKQCQP